MKKNAVFSAYGRLKYDTPLKYDCGKLCDGLCCKGADDRGMILYPGEEKLFSDKKGFQIKKDSLGRNILICKSDCNRKIRPLSCRMYPLFPYVYEENGEIKLKVIYDIRGLNSCPVVFNKIKVSKKFIQSVRLAGKELLREEDCKKMLWDISREIDDIIKINEMMRG